MTNWPTKNRKINSMQKLRVKQGKLEEINKDIIRVHELHRKEEDGEEFKIGAVCKVYVNETGKDIYAILRGHLDNSHSNKDYIAIDETLREKLGLESGREYHFTFKKARKWFGWVRWAWDASDPAYQISIRIAVMLGSISVLLGIISMFFVFC